ncbi:MAG: hypothetical protein HY919_03885 [Elusimicrobia bacterium]|nr:hypothetical protein [Elusimicrobiota bacterium]
MSTKVEKISSRILEILENKPEGLRHSEIIKKIIEVFPDISINTIYGSIWDFMQKTKEVYKPSRGLYKHIKFKNNQIFETEKEVPHEVKKIKEEDFYELFADWLVNDLEECTKAIPLGGNKFKDKWGTPDVIGKNESNRSDIIKHETEIVSAEIKTDDSGLITAFGQACAYKSFSHKVYIVIPKSSSEEDKSRIESLCLIFGIGLILFDSNNIEQPDFEIRVRPVKFEPDLFYVNKYIKLIEDELFS